MNHKPAIANGATAVTNKCVRCGHRNFSNRELSAYYGSGLFMPLTVARTKPGRRHISGEIGSLKVGLACILAAMLALILGLVLFHTKEIPQESAEPISAANSEPPATSHAEQAAPDAPVGNGPQSEEAAKQVLSELKGFEGIAQGKMDYDEYDQKLNNLKADVNKALPAFVRHTPSDETFRQEIASAIRDYTAAGNWWKTTIRNSSLFNEADRNEYLQPKWASAQSHIDTADKILLR